MVDEEEEALDHAGRTLAVPPLHTPPRGLPGMFQLVPFTGVSPIMMDSSPSSGLSSLSQGHPVQQRQEPLC